MLQILRSLVIPMNIVFSFVLSGTLPTLFSSLCCLVVVPPLTVCVCISLCCLLAVHTKLETLVSGFNQWKCIFLESGIQNHRTKALPLLVLLDCLSVFESATPLAGGRVPTRVVDGAGVHDRGVCLRCRQLGDGRALLSRVEAWT